MGRELKRVPLDFMWPMNAVWKGYINPYRGVKCGACDGTGHSEKAMKFNEDWYSLDKHHRIPNPYIVGSTYNSLARHYNLTKIEIDALLKHGRLDLDWFGGREITPESVKEWQLKNSLGLDSYSRLICLEATAEAEGWDANCPFCGGLGTHWFSEEIKKLYEEWRRQDPPTGEGYQLWTTTNEGAPISPVFSSMEELAKWCETGATVSGNRRTSYEEWLAFFQKECAGYELLPGMVVV